MTGDPTFPNQCCTPFQPWNAPKDLLDQYTKLVTRLYRLWDDYDHGVTATDIVEYRLREMLKDAGAF